MCHLLIPVNETMMDGQTDIVKNIMKLKIWAERDYGSWAWLKQSLNALRAERNLGSERNNHNEWENPITWMLHSLSGCNNLLDKYLTKLLH